MALNAISMPDATLEADERFYYPDGAFVVMKVWSVPVPVPPTGHGYKYSLVYIVGGETIIGYDNERGKGDHRHYRGTEQPYIFHSMKRLLADFMADVEKLRNEIEDESQREG